MGRLAPIVRPLTLSDLPSARAVLKSALPFDNCTTVAQEKLFGPNPRQNNLTVGAFSTSGKLCGVLSLSGRFVKILAVAEYAQRQGVGSELLDLARKTVAAWAPGQKVRVGDCPGNYLSPGVDIRSSSARLFLVNQGFVECDLVVNLRVNFKDNPFVTQARCDAARALAEKAGYTLRRATAQDVEPLLRCVSTHFSRTWAFEVSRALGPEMGGVVAEDALPLPEGPSVHVALSLEGEPVAFAAHDGNNRGLGWFGPMGTLPAHRGKGLGEALLLACLLDVRDREEGGIIAWTGPTHFYERVCNAQQDRVFLPFEEQ